MTTLKFTQENKTAARVELNSLVELAVDRIYIDRIAAVSTVIKAKAALARENKMKAWISLADKRFDATQPHDKVIKHVVDNFEKHERRLAYRYVGLTRRVILLDSLVASKVKLRTVAKKTLEGLIRAELNVKPGKGVTLAQLMASCPLKVKQVINHDGGVTELNPLNTDDMFIMEEFKLQFISELVEMDLIDMRISDHAHMVEVPTVIGKDLDKGTAKRMQELNAIVSSKTIYTTPVALNPKQLISRSSWFYRTPTLSADQAEFVNQMHSMKYRFKADALDRLEECYKEHLRDDNGAMPEAWEQWVPAKLAFFREQIKESNANGGHFIEGKFDSSLRWYMQAEIGHFQTSKALRSLVEIASIKNPIKRDFKNNVIQMYSILMKVRDLGKYVGLLPHEDRADDLRLQIADELNAKLDTNAYTKDNIKPLFMVWAYNAGANRILDGVTVTEEQPFGMPSLVNVKVPGLLALAGAKDTEKNREIIWGAFEATVLELVPAVVVLKTLFSKLIKLNPLTETSWTLPDGAVAQYASAATQTQELYWVSNDGKTHQHSHHLKLIVENEKRAGLLPRVIHSVDAWVARQLVIRAARLGVEVVPNHDSFMFDEEYEELIEQIISELFIELLKSSILADILAELNKSGKSLAIRNNKGAIITNDMLMDAYGELTVADLEQADPTDLEEI